jgi:hypothetical protein
MFDLRYHVASLAAVFLALIIGILFGVAISGRGLISEGERRQLNAEIDRLRDRLDEARRRAGEHAGDEEYVNETYAAVMSDRLADRDVAMVFVGSIDPELRAAIEETLTRASGRRLRLRAIKVPLIVADLEASLPADTPGLRDPERIGEVGRLLGEELVIGGSTPLWDALADLIVEQQSGGMSREADAVVLVRSARPQAGETARFLAGLYRGIASVGVPVAAVQSTDGEDTELEVFESAGFSTVNNVDTPAGRLALAVLLAGDASGSFGVDAEDGYLPRVDIVEPTPAPRD